MEGYRRDVCIEYEGTRHADTMWKNDVAGHYLRVVGHRAME